jgi:F420H(2)-dependent quinone reductase
MKALMWLQRRVGNPLVIAILRSPFHGLISRRIVLLSILGRRSGTRITIPVGYVSEGATLHVLVAGKPLKRWWHNLEGGAPVAVLLRGRAFEANAEALTFEQDARRFTTALRNYVAGNPRAAVAVGIRDVEDIAGLRAAAGDVVMVTVRLGRAVVAVP